MFDEFNKRIDQELDDFRSKINQDMAEYMKEPWPEFRKEKPMELPVDPDPIIIYYDVDPDPSPTPNKIPLKDVVPSPKPSPLPSPVQPIQDIPSVTAVPVNFNFYGCNVQIECPDISSLKIPSSSPESISYAYTALSKAHLNNTLNSCLKIRDDLGLNDWGYILLAKSLASNIYKSDINSQSLFIGFVLNQSGYDIRYCYENSGRLNVLFTSLGIVTSIPYFMISGKRYYPLFESQSAQAYICDFKFPGEQAMSFAMNKIPKLPYKRGNEQIIKCHAHPDLQVSVIPNKNLMDFYNDYPTASTTESTIGRFLIYGNVPASNEFKNQLYPKLNGYISGKNQREAANILIKLAESFEYKLDEEMWGVGDKALFPDETWQYFYSDCEDHAIHFTRLVRDLMGLEAALVYYPGHLASAVVFTDGSVSGDYILHNGKKYTICDPTIFFGPVGMTMQGMDNKEAILLELQP